MSKEGSHRIDQEIARLKDWRGTTLAAVRRVFLSADPHVTEEWKWMGTPTWECDGIIAIANAHASKVKITFANGARLPDPTHVFNAGLGGSRWRAIDILEGVPVPEGPLRELARAAIALNREESSLRTGARAKGAAGDRTVVPTRKRRSSQRRA